MTPPPPPPWLTSPYTWSCLWRSAPGSVSRLRWRLPGWGEGWGQAAGAQHGAGGGGGGDDH